MGGRLIPSRDSSDGPLGLIRLGRHVHWATNFTALACGLDRSGSVDRSVTPLSAPRVLPSELSAAAITCSDLLTMGVEAPRIAGARDARSLKVSCSSRSPLGHATPELEPTCLQATRATTENESQGAVIAIRGE